MASIHSFFVFFPFDVLFLDENCTILGAETVGSFRFHVTPSQPAKFIVELPAGTISKTGVKEGGRVEFFE